MGYRDGLPGVGIGIEWRDRIHVRVVFVDEELVIKIGIRKR